MIRLGLRENLPQFSLLVLINAFVGAMVGLERSILPLLGEQEFGLRSKTVILSFIATFGVVKALSNFAAGMWSDKVGRKKLLVLGWIAGLPIPFLIIFAPSWNWIIAANLLLGINQGLCWSTTVVMKIDLVGPRLRGLAMGLNEFAGYISVAISAWLSAWIAQRYHLRPEPFYLGICFAVCGLVLTLFAKETHEHSKMEAKQTTGGNHAHDLSVKQIFQITSWRDKTLFSCSQAGLINNLNDGMAWGLLPLFFMTAASTTIGRIGILSALYPATWGILQLVTGAMSDRTGRKWMIVTGMWVQAAGIALIAGSNSYVPWIIGLLMMGIGTAQVYPTLLAAIGDVANPLWRATAVGVYRLWRDAGYAIGALLSGLAADLFGLSTAIMLVAAITFLSGLVSAFIMKETKTV